MAATLATFGLPLVGYSNLNEVSGMDRLNPSVLKSHFAAIRSYVHCHKAACRVHSVNKAEQTGNRIRQGSVSKTGRPRASSVDVEEPTIVGDIPEPVLVVGATGGVGQLVVASLLERNVAVRALIRDAAKAQSLFGQQLPPNLEVIVADLRNPASLKGPLFEGLGAVIVCSGTTAFPSARWKGGGPAETDMDGVRNLLAAISPTVSRIVLISSAGVTRYTQFPYSVLNLFGVLKYKAAAEEMVRSSGILFTIIRPGRLTDGPYTSYDLNTLLKATSGMRRSVIIEKGDSLSGETSRLAVAEACIQALSLESTVGETFLLKSVEGDGPDKDSEKWDKLFRSAPGNVA